MTFQQAILTCFAKYVTFSGRASRSEYWWFVLFLFLASSAAGVIDRAIYGDDLIETHIIDDQTYATIETTGPLASIFGLLTLLPFVAAGWRRMHDTGKSGLFLFYPMIAIVGLATFAGLFAPADMASGGEIILPGGLIGAVLVFAGVIVALSPFLVLWWLTRPSQPGPNQYGPNPHEVHI